jgi:hypothetical protein
MTDTKWDFRLVVLESPYSTSNGRTIKQNEEYARRCVYDSVHRGEAPIASHLLFTQPGVLDDGVPHERERGIEAGLAWVPRSDYTVVYEDWDVTSGMQTGIARAKAAGHRVVFRKLGENGDSPGEREE